MALLHTYRYLEYFHTKLHPYWAPPIRLHCNDPPSYMKEPNYYNYMVTITPKGKKRTHELMLADIIYHFMGRKSIIKFWLFREFTQTNHFHGIVQCKREAKLKFNIEISVVHNNGLIQNEEKTLLYILKDQRYGDKFTYYNRYSKYRFPRTKTY